MPTGYTAALETMNYDVNKWVSESLVRAMGLCVSLRDEPSDLSAEEIRKHLATGTSDKYHEESLAKAQKELKNLKDRTDQEWSDTYNLTKATMKKEYEASVKKHKENEAKHRQAMKEIQELLDRAEREGHVKGSVIWGTLHYGKQQLESAYEYDYGSGPYKPDILSLTLREWRDERIESARRMVIYHAENLEKIEEKRKGQTLIQSYDQLLAFLGTQPKQTKAKVAKKVSKKVSKKTKRGK